MCKCIVQYNTVQYSTVQYSTVQCSTNTIVVSRQVSSLIASKWYACLAACVFTVGVSFLSDEDILVRVDSDRLGGSGGGSTVKSIVSI
jgi:hypothetical protein